MMASPHDLGQVFPPRDEWDVAAYDSNEVVAGYRDHAPDDPVPGPNHSPAYRWGWTNRRRDAMRNCDGFDGIRHAYFELSRNVQ